MLPGPPYEAQFMPQSSEEGDSNKKKDKRMKIKDQKENRLTNNMCKCAYFHVLCQKLEAAVAGSLFRRDFSHAKYFYIFT